MQEIQVIAHCLLKPIEQCLHKELAKGTLLDILHQTGLSRDDLEELLK